MAGNKALPVAATPGSSAIGRVVDCTALDVSGPLGPAIVRELTEAMVAARGLLVCRFDRVLSADEQAHFSRAFGELEVGPGMLAGVGRVGLHPQIKDAVSTDATREQQLQALLAKGTNPYVVQLSNVDEKALLGTQSNTDFATSEWEWHTDMSYVPTPPAFSLLHCHEVPKSGGGRTSYASMIAAYEALSPQTQALCKARHCKHDSTYGSSGALRPGMTAPASPVQAIGHVHPLVRWVALYGKEALFLGRRTNGYVPELPLEESEKFLNELWSHTYSQDWRKGSSDCYTHDWRKGDLVIWDNRVLVHHREPFDPAERRDMKRTQIVGEPVLPSAGEGQAARL